MHGVLSAVHMFFFRTRAASMLLSSGRPVAYVDETVAEQVNDRNTNCSLINIRELQANDFDFQG